MEENIKNHYGKKSWIFTLIIVLYPILFVYYSGISSLSIADIILIAFVLIDTVELPKNKYLTVSPEWLVYLVYIVIFGILSYNGFDTITTMMRFAIYLYAIAVLVPRYIDIRILFKVYRVVALITAGFAILQAVGVYLFGKYIPGTLNFLPLMRSELYSYGTNYTGGVLRVRAFFGEPAHLATFLSLYLLLVLSSNIKNKHAEALVVSLALVFSVSSTAYYCLAFIWALYAVDSFRNAIKKGTDLNKITIAVLVTVVGVLLLFLLFRSSLFSMFWKRTVVEQDSIHGRFDSYQLFKEHSYQDSFYKIFGHGFSDVRATYLSSVPLFYWRFGYFGLLFFFAIIMCTLKKSKSKVATETIILFIMLGIGTQIFASYYIMLYIAVAITARKGSYLYERSFETDHL